SHQSTHWLSVVGADGGVGVLFRSSGLRQHPPAQARQHGHGGEVVIPELGVHLVDPHPGGHAGLEGANDIVADRKSTRLNSSHVSISYAVFCLKKKNNCQVYWCR